jgi:hypothetical protein
VLRAFSAVELCALLLSSRSSIDRVKDSMKRMFDRTDSSVVAYHDLAKNIVLFGAVIYCMHKFGHKLAV